MGSGLSTLFPCFKPPTCTDDPSSGHQPDLIFTASEPLEETLGHSFCYFRSSNRFLSPTPSDRFVSPSQSLRFSPSHESGQRTRSGSGLPETGFKTISGASVSANTSTPRTVLQLDHIYDDATDGGAGGVKSNFLNVGGFESTSSFSALTLQPVPRGGGGGGDTAERGSYLMSGPIERGGMSGPLDASNAGPCSDTGGRVHFSAPLGGMYVKRKRRRGISSMRKAFYRNFSEKKRPWVVPVLNFVTRKDQPLGPTGNGAEDTKGGESDVQWALGKAGEDRVHVVVSEEQGWLFVGIYDGFNGPDAPDFLMSNLYRAVYNELRGLFWEIDEGPDEATTNAQGDTYQENETIAGVEQSARIEHNESDSVPHDRAKRVTFEEGAEIKPQKRRLWEFLAEDDPEDGLDLSGSDRFAFSVDDAISVNNAGSAARRRWLLLSKLKQGLSKQREGRLFPWRFRLEGKEEEVKTEVEDSKNSKVEGCGPQRKRKEGPIDHEMVLRALSRALQMTEDAFLDMTDKVLDSNPELALMGSCLLVVLMRDEDVYVMNVGDSRAIVAMYEQQEAGPSVGGTESSVDEGGNKEEGKAARAQATLTALQLSTDHSMSIEEEVTRIRNEHPDDSQCIVNDRVKGRLKVTRAFGAGFLKQPKLNDALLGMFRNKYVGTSPYVSCVPAICHHRLCPSDQFLVLSSDGLYQYLSNQEVVSHVESFMEKFPDGDPAQHLIEELLCRAAKKAGMEFHELLDIPQGDRRKYHDDVTVMIVSLEGRIWKSSGKYL
ncbi:protein phosphatase 2C 29 [Tripterygium wilfordii]|uniref:protein-serine/threonine phosphatase n=1 Tax=Tripterygium wilfordii TaxID=458696 RepID=A0A7J7CM13_TRIWF|nr:protein phosphatase 2C 29-like [Tripterygium wilfordii]KAF5735084.1 protein phosphatase 2C 29 [Tripterygium wilfordii]